MSSSLLRGVSRHASKLVRGDVPWNIGDDHIEKSGFLDIDSNTLSNYRTWTPDMYMTCRNPPKKMHHTDTVHKKRQEPNSRSTAGALVTHSSYQR
jgi:hypothetical protein